jgi:hypothetical protein
METSPSNFHGTGVSRSPAVAPAPPINKSRLETFIVAPSFVTTETAHLDFVAAMAGFAVAHFHAVMRSAPQARDGMAPNVAAVAADPVFLVNSRLIGFPEVSMALRAGQACAACVDGMREPDIGGLPRGDQPRCFASWLNVIVHQDGFGFRRTEFFGVAPGAGFYPGDASEFAATPERMAGIALSETRFFAVCFVMEVQRLFPPDIEGAWEGDPTSYDRKCNSKTKNK